MTTLDIPEQPLLVLFNSLFPVQSQEDYREGAERSSKFLGEWDHPMMALLSRLCVDLELS